MEREVDKRLAPMLEHGLDVTGLNRDSTQYVADCPFCGKAGHFFVNRQSLLWDCKVCGRSGNLAGYLAQQAVAYREAFRGKVCQDLWGDRGIKPATMQAWGVGWNGRYYTIPVNGNARRAVVNIKRYRPGGKALSTPGCKLGLLWPIESPDTDVVWLCEGEWDAMAWWECLQANGVQDAVWAAPGSTVMPQESVELFTQKQVRVLYDNDKAGRDGGAKLVSKLGGVVHSLEFIHWPPDYADGYDIRDLWRDQKRAKSVLKDVLGWLKPNPVGVVVEGSGSAPVAGPVQYKGEGLLPAKAAEEYQKWLHMVDTDCLDIMFGTVFANRLDGDPLWMFLVAPPGGMKTELLMSLSDAPGIIETTTLTQHSLVSGYQAGGTDPSLLPKLNQRVLVVKDFTPMLGLSQNVREEVFSTLRDVYDGKTEKWFGNGVHRRYESKFGVLAGVTPAIESMGNSSTVLGERFVRYRISGSARIMSGKERIMRALSNLHQNTAMRDGLRATGKHVLDWDIAGRPYPEVPRQMLERIATLAQWVGILRGVVVREKYTQQVQFKPMAEIGTRLAKQLLKLAYGIAHYHRADHVTEKVYTLVAKVALSTAPDRVEETIRQIYIHTEKVGHRFTTNELAGWTHLPPDTLRYLLQDLALLNIVEANERQWRLTRGMYDTMRALHLYRRDRLWRTNRNTV